MGPHICIFPNQSLRSWLWKMQIYGPTFYRSLAQEEIVIAVSFGGGRMGDRASKYVMILGWRDGDIIGGWHRTGNGIPFPLLIPRYGWSQDSQGRSRLFVLVEVQSWEKVLVRELYYSCSLNVLPSLAWVLLKYVLQRLFLCRGCQGYTGGLD